MRWPWSRALIAIGVAAFAWRLSFLLRLMRSILFGDLYSDAAIFWTWSGRIMRGELPHPAPFFFGPIYAYGLAVARQLAGRRIESILVVQCLLGAITCVLLTDTVRRVTSRRAALVVGMLLALNPMLVFFDAQVLMESLLLALQALLIWIIAASSGGRLSAPRSLMAGILIGLMAEGRSLFLVLLIPLLALIARANAGRRGRLLAAAAAVLGTALVTVFSLAHNIRAGAGWLPYTYSFGYNLYVGNHAGASGTFATITGTSDITVDSTRIGADWGSADGRDYIFSTTGRRLGPRESSSHWAALATHYVRAEPASALRGLGMRLLMLWNHHEYPQIENADEFRTVCGPLGLPILGGFGGLAILALIGLGDAWNSGATARWLIANLGLLTIGTAVFFVTDRYRCHLIPATAALSAWGIERVWTSLRERIVPRGAIAGALAALLVVFAPLPYVHGARYEWSLNADLGARWLKRDPGRASSYFANAIALEPSFVVVTPANLFGALERATVYSGYAEALRRSGEVDAAANYLAAAAGLAPESARIQAEWAAMSKRMQGAGGMTERAWAAAQRNQFAAAESLFALAVATDPHQPDAWAALVRLRIQRADVAGADSALSMAGQAGLGGASLVAHRALVAAARGDRESARMLLAQVPPGAASDPLLSSVIQATRQLLQRPPSPASR